jgi:glycosyltransferase involved in cell wall biosynthesis
VTPNEYGLQGEVDKLLPTVSVIMPTFNRIANLAQAVAPLLRDPATTELIVVLDGCRDGSIELLRGLAIEEPRLRPVPITNRGKQRALQVGVAIATGDVVLILDDDLVAADGLVAGHARHHRDIRNLMVIGYTPTLIPKKWLPGDTTTWLWDLEYERYCRGWQEHPETILKNLYGCNFSMRRVDCEHVGFVSPEFPDLYHQDQDFGLRCRKAGLTAVFDESLTAEHRHRRSVEGFMRDAYSQGAGQWMLHQIHADVMGPLDPRTFERSLPRPIRLLIRATRSAAARAIVLGLVRLGLRLAGLVRWFNAELACMRIGRRVLQQAGMLDAVAAAASGSGFESLRRGGHIEVSGVREHVRDGV